MDYSATLLAAIFPNQRERFLQCTGRIDKAMLATRAQQVLWEIAETTVSRYGDLPTPAVVQDVLVKNLDAGEASLVWHTYATACQTLAQDLEFKHARDALLDLQAKNATGEALATAYEILETGYDVSGKRLKGHEEAREYLSSQMAVISRQRASTEAPEGDLQSEAQQFHAEYQNRKNNPDGAGISTGMPTVDEASGGIMTGDLALIAGWTGSGKASPLWTPVLTPDGWREIGSLEVGDLITGSDGQPQKVLQVHDRGSMATFRVTTQDGGNVVTAGDHLWSVQDQHQRAKGSGWSTYSTMEIRERLAKGRRHFLPVLSGPVEFAQQAPLPLHPYVVGVLLGDGHTTKTVRVTNSEPEILDRLAELTGVGLTKYTGESNYALPGLGLLATLRSLGMIGPRAWEKSIPATYLTAPWEDRLELLRGLMDTDGTPGDRVGSCEFSSTSHVLAKQVQELVWSLGGSTGKFTTKKAGYRKEDGTYVECHPAHRFLIRMPLEMNPFRLGRKKERWDALYLSRTHYNLSPRRVIASVEPLGEEPVRCISVENGDHLYVTEDYLITHNSQLTIAVAYEVAVIQKKNFYYATSETTRTDIMNRFVARHSLDPKFNFPEGLNHSKIRQAKLNPTEEDVFRAVLADLASGAYGKMHFAQVPRGATLTQVEVRALAKHRDWGVDLLAIDYLNLLKPEGKRQTQREEASDILKDAKTLATSFGGTGVALISPWQVSREAYRAALQSTSYDLTALSEASEAEKSSDLILTLWHDENAVNRASLQMLKCRNGAKSHKIPLDVDYARAYLKERNGEGGGSGY